MSEPARVLHADPPWQFGDKLPGKTRGAARQYPCLSVDQIKAFELPELARDCMLMLWRVSAMRQEALDVVRAWGFTLKSEIVWHKLTPTGKSHFGMGHYVRASHETCIVAVRGRVKVANRSVRSVFAAPAPRDERGRVIHSAKPDEIYTIAAQLMPDGPFTELFGRRMRPGWTVYGNEVRP